MSGANVWERFPLDPRDERHARLRASDRDRDVANDVLGTAYADGRLTPDELDERSNRVALSKTLGELPELLDDLVVPRGPGGPAVPGAPVTPALMTGAARSTHHAEAELRYRRLRLVTLLVFLVPTLICWVVWGSLRIAGSDAFLWAVFPTLGTSIPLLVVLAAHRDFVSSQEHRLVRQEARRRGRELPPPMPPASPTSS